jgi:hypothetical protein
MLPYRIELNVVYRDMYTAYMLIDMVALRKKPMQLICSPTGFGKTTIAKKCFKHRGVIQIGQRETEVAMRRAVRGLLPFGDDPAMIRRIRKGFSSRRSQKNRSRWSGSYSNAPSWVLWLCCLMTQARSHRTRTPAIS